MTHRTIAKFFAGPALEDTEASDNNAIEVVALISAKTKEATSFRVYFEGVQHGEEHKTARDALRTATDLALITVYDHEPSVTK